VFNAMRKRRGSVYQAVVNAQVEDPANPGSLRSVDTMKPLDRNPNIGLRKQSNTHDFRDFRHNRFC